MFSKRTSISKSWSAARMQPTWVTILDEVRMPVWCSVLLIFCVVLLASCEGTAVTPPAGATKSVAGTRQVTATLTTAAPTMATSGVTPQHFKARVILQGKGRPDDLVFDQSENVLLFSDFYNGTISSITLNGVVTVLLRGLAGPEGMIVLPDHSLIFAEQNTNRILLLAPGTHTPTVLRTIPGMSGQAECKHGIDGIAWDPTTTSIIVPDSPTGDVYSLSLDGKTLKLLASGITRPVGAAVDKQGNIYVADECGGAVWRITPDGAKTRIGGFGMPDDVVIDPHGNLLIIDLQPAIHALIRMNMTTGKREVLANKGFIEPQGLLVDMHDNIFLSDDYADIIVEYQPV